MNNFSLARTWILGAALVFAGETVNTHPGLLQAAPAQTPTRLEVEVVAIDDLRASPAAIKAKPGPFILYFENRSHVFPADLFVDSATEPAAAVTSLSQALHLNYLPRLRHMSAVVIAPPGVYQIKSRSTGGVVLTLTIR